MDDSTIQQEMDKLDSQFNSSMRSLQRQKGGHIYLYIAIIFILLLFLYYLYFNLCQGNAVRWMSRQKIRLISQAKEIHHGKLPSY
jgi:hypothetical protein